MRFNKRITFITEGESYYDPIIGDYVEGKKDRDVVPANISKTSAEQSKQLFGDIDTIMTIARLQRPYAKEFDYIEIDSKPYKLVRNSSVRKGVYYLERDNVG